MIRDGGPVTPENWRCVIASSTHPTGLEQAREKRAHSDLEFAEKQKAVARGRGMLRVRKR